MATLRNRVPIVMSVLFITGLVVLAWLNLTRLAGTGRILGLVLVALYLLWLIIESRVAVRETGQDQTRLDRGTCELYAGARAATTVACLALPSGWSGALLPMGLGLGIFILGVTLRLVAIGTLGRFYSHRVRVAADQHVVTSGPYALVRHPAYTGMLLAHAGVVVCLGSLAGAALLCLAFIPAVVRRILVEERALFGIPGYAEYAARRKRLVPLVW